MSVSERIKARRLEEGLSVDEVADELGVSRATVYRYESAEIANMGIDKLEPLAKALNTTPAYLMGWTDDPYDYSLDPDSRFDEIPKSMFDVLVERCKGDMQLVWHTWENIQNDNARQASMDYSDYVETIKNPDIRLIARAGKKLSPEDAQKLLTVAKTLFPEAFDDT